MKNMMLFIDPSIHYILLPWTDPGEGFLKIENIYAVYHKRVERRNAESALPNQIIHMLQIT